MARPKKIPEVPGQEKTQAVNPKPDAPGSQVLPAGEGEGIPSAIPAIATRNALLSTLNEQAAAIITRFEAYGFSDIIGHPLIGNAEFIELVRKATAPAPAAIRSYVTNDEGKRQPAGAKPVLTAHGWHVPG